MAHSDYKIGVVGVGRIGGNVARHLKDKGFAMSVVYDIRSEIAKELATELGISASETLAGVTKAVEYIMTFVTDDHAMRSIFATGRDSLLQGAQGKLFINCATITPQVHVEVEKLAEQVGAQSLEGCMASSLPQARDGTLYLMCGGKREAFERAKPILEAMSAKLTYVGEAGRAAQVKVLVNMVMNINTAGLAEGLGLGVALGLDLAMLRDVFAHTGANSRVVETDGLDMQNRDHECYFSAAHAAKDSGIALKLGKAAGLTLPLAEATARQYEQLVAIGKGELDKSGIAELTFPGRG